MKKFLFPLERVHAWRRLEYDRECAVLASLEADLKAGVQREQAIRDERVQCEQSLARSIHFEAHEVGTLANWQAQVSRSLAAMAMKQQQTQARVAQQRAKVSVAERQVKLLERLRERRHSAWLVEVSKEEEALAAESYLARGIRLKAATLGPPQSS